MNNVEVLLGLVPGGLRPSPPYSSQEPVSDVLSVSLRDHFRVSKCQRRPPWQKIMLTSFLLLLLIVPKPRTVQAPWVGRDTSV